MNINSKKAFTLSEVLITLSIVGVVSAITLPLLINKIHDVQYTRGREIALSIFGEAGRRLAMQGEINQAVNAGDFVENYYGRHIKISKYCGTNPSECGFSDNIKKLGGKEKLEGGIPTTLSGLNSDITFTVNNNATKNSSSYAFLTANGYSANLYYNKNCMDEYKGTGGHSGADRVCVNTVYDMNGRKGPNEVGKDIGFVTIFFPDITTRAVAPSFAKDDLGLLHLQIFYNPLNNYANRCTIPDRYDMVTAMFNYNLTNLKGSNQYWTNASISGGLWTGLGWTVHKNGMLYPNGKTVYFYIRCTK